ncbi:glycoside hydrolase family 3 protein [Paratractidigestivibacter sp.]|uniref:glycoside hydrolase family 3 protein n=1 Tax=Paratractidigestivibacter sp. TaxID=2847316 RepID=UPI002AC99808|nr:glycoside hydrolase family 3 N-terminal domain-containing protein [Paratractidigestivibacter sp.]
MADTPQGAAPQGADAPKGKKPKLKMSNLKFRVLLIIPMVLLLLIALAVNTATSMMKSTLDTYVGKGETTIVTPSDKADWDGSYYTEAASADEAKEAAYAVAAQVQDEGTVLLKNDNAALPLAKGATVMPFGYAFLNPSYGQNASGGSAKWVADPVTPEQGLAGLAIDNAAVDAMNAAGEVTPLIEAEGTTAAGEAGSLLGGDCKLYEYDPTIYDGIAANPDATGLVFITRFGQEGQDQKSDAYSDGTRHYLALSSNERGTIAAAKAKCGKVVVILVSSAPLECADLMEGDLAVDAVVYYGHPGERGFSQLASILDGDVNPSGRTVDIWASDFLRDENISRAGQGTYSNLTTTSSSYTDGGTFNRGYNEYQEGVYMGYRYYETAAEVDSTFSYDDAVVYPFGYGLSYTTFSQTLDSVVENDGQVVATVTVTNTGSVAGKEVVQVYSSSPYTELDQQAQIEKPSCVLAAFDKTKLLEPGQSQTLTLSFAKEDLASYCYTHDNGDGTTGCYVLEAGDYGISLRANSHDVIATATVSQAETIWYDGSDNDHIRESEKAAQSDVDATTGEALVDDSAEYKAATNKFQQSSDYMNTDSQVLSRSDWAGTQTEFQATKEISPQFAEGSDLFVTFDVQTDAAYGNVEGSEVYVAEQPTSGAKNGLTVSDMRGLDYDDPMWSDLLDQIDWSADKDNIIQNFSGDAYTTAAISSIGLPATVDMDGINGLKVQGADNGYDMTKSSSFGFAPLMASTWNVDLIYQVGAAFGQESLANGISGWYAPAINLHRSMFSGRVFEYYSEDPLLSGKLAAAAISGAGDQGMYCYVKHFAMNETETGRAALVCTWADEQTMRELYLRPFEIALEESRMTVRYSDSETGEVKSRIMRAGTAVMATQTCMGTRLGHTNDALLKDLLRDEWGFEGMVISDYWTWGDNNLRDLCVRTGCDTYLCMSMPVMWSISDYDSATARTAMRNAIHNISYTVANSNALQGMVPGSYTKTAVSPWQIGVWVFDLVVVALLAGGVVLMVRRTKAVKAHPELYRGKKR